MSSANNEMSLDVGREAPLFNRRKEVIVILAELCGGLVN